MCMASKHSPVAEIHGRGLPEKQGKGEGGCGRGPGRLGRVWNKMNTALSIVLFSQRMQLSAAPAGD